MFAWKRHQAVPQVRVRILYPFRHWVRRSGASHVADLVATVDAARLVAPLALIVWHVNGPGQPPCRNPLCLFPLVRIATLPVTPTFGQRLPFSTQVSTHKQQDGQIMVSLSFVLLIGHM